jgi:hypothetical protein
VTYREAETGRSYQLHLAAIESFQKNWTADTTTLSGAHSLQCGYDKKVRRKRQTKTCDRLLAG